MSGEYFQQAIFGRRDIVGLHYGQKHERVSSFCRSLHEDSKQTPDGVKVSIRWDDKRGQWIVASSSRDIVHLVIDWIKESEKEFLVQSVERAIQPMLILEGKSDEELEDLRRRRREEADQRRERVDYSRDRREQRDQRDQRDQREQRSQSSSKPPRFVKPTRGASGATGPKK